MKLSDLKGAVVSSELVEKEIVWTRDVDGEEVTDTFTVFVKRPSFGDVERIFVGGDDKSRSAAMIAACIRMGDQGEEALTYDQAYQLTPSLAKLLSDAVREVTDAKND